MPKSSNQKLKLLYIIKILSEQTDEQHCMATRTLIEQLEKYDISAERKAIYSDINQLIHFGYDIIYKNAKNCGGYYMAGRDFEMPELKLLVDAVLSSRFITLKKSRELIRKIEGLAGRHDGSQMQRQVYVAGRVKTDNESIYYTVDAIHNGIGHNKMISFLYLDWTPEKTLKPRREGARYIVSPWALTWQDENYYLIAWDSNVCDLKHYRVDKMDQVMILDENRQGGDFFRNFDVVAHVNKTFGMFGGGEEAVTLEFPERMTGIMIDRFGKEILIRKIGSNRISARVSVAVSEQFFGWLTGLGEEVVISAPEYVKQRYRTFLLHIIKNYPMKEEGAEV